MFTYDGSLKTERLARTIFVPEFLRPKTDVLLTQEYILPMLDENLRMFLSSDRRLKSVAYRCLCDVELTNRILHRRILNTNSNACVVRYAIVRVRGPTLSRIYQFNRLVERMFPEYTQRQDYTGQNFLTLFRDDILPDNLNVVAAGQRLGPSSNECSGLEVNSPYRLTEKRQQMGCQWKIGDKEKNGLAAFEPVAIEGVLDCYHQATISSHPSESGTLERRLTLNQQGLYNHIHPMNSDFQEDMSNPNIIYDFNDIAMREINMMRGIPVEDTALPPHLGSSYAEESAPSQVADPAAKQRVFSRYGKSAVFAPMKVLTADGTIQELSVKVDDPQTNRIPSRNLTPQITNAEFSRQEKPVSSMLMSAPSKQEKPLSIVMSSPPSMDPTPVINVTPKFTEHRSQLTPTTYSPTKVSDPRGIIEESCYFAAEARDIPEDTEESESMGNGQENERIPLTLSATMADNYRNTTTCEVDGAESRDNRDSTVDEQPNAAQIEAWMQQGTSQSRNTEVIKDQWYSKDNRLFEGTLAVRHVEVFSEEKLTTPKEDSMIELFSPNSKLGEVESSEQKNQGNLCGAASRLSSETGTHSRNLPPRHRWATPSSINRRSRLFSGSSGDADLHSENVSATNLAARCVLPTKAREHAQSAQPFNIKPTAAACKARMTICPMSYLCKPLKKRKNTAGPSASAQSDYSVTESVSRGSCRQRTYSDQNIINFTNNSSSLQKRPFHVSDTFLCLGRSKYFQYPSPNTKTRLEKWLKPMNREIPTSTTSSSILPIMGAPMETHNSTRSSSSSTCSKTSLKVFLRNLTKVHNYPYDSQAPGHSSESTHNPHGGVDSSLKSQSLCLHDTVPNATSCDDSLSEDDYPLHHPYGHGCIKVNQDPQQSTHRMILLDYATSKTNSCISSREVPATCASEVHPHQQLCHMNHNNSVAAKPQFSPISTTNLISLKEVSYKPCKTYCRQILPHYVTLSDQEVQTEATHFSYFIKLPAKM